LSVVSNLNRSSSFKTSSSVGKRWFKMIKLKPASPQRIAEVLFGNAILWMFVYAAIQLSAGHPVEPYIY